MIDVKKLVLYNESVRHRYFEALSRLPWKEFVKNREASFHSLRNIFIHTLDAIDYWLDFLQKENLHTHRKFDQYHTFQDVETYMEHVETRTHKYFNSLPTGRLKKKYEITSDTNEPVEITAEDVLIHVFEEEVHHRGELIALLWQMNVQPPQMGWKEL